MKIRTQRIVGLLFLLLSVIAGAVACAGLSLPTEEGGLEGTGDNAGDNANDNTDGTPDDALVFEYLREGGIAGFCDVVMVYANGEVTISSCATDPPQVVNTTRLNDEQLAMVQGWVENLESFETGHKDNAVADAMTIRVEFHGNGDGEAAAEDVQAIQDLAVQLLQQPATQ
jgi:hypothetical protein